LKEKCDKDPNCKAYNYAHPNGVWGKASGGCIKTTATPITPSKKVDIWVKKPPTDFCVKK